MDWGNAIRTYREKHGLLQKQLAYDFGVDVMTVSRWERGISEPSTKQKGRIKDFMAGKKDPLSLPFIQRLTKFDGSASIVDLKSGNYIFFSNDAGLSRLEAEEVIGHHSMKFVETEIIHQGYDGIGGYAGMLQQGLMSFNYRLKCVPVCEGTVEIMGSILKFQEYDPVLVIQRRPSETPPVTSHREIELVFEDDLPS